MKKSIQIDNLTKTFKLKAGLFSSGKTRVHALNSVSLQIGKLSSFGIVGESGSGKSTLAKTLAGAYQIDSGEINYKLSNKSINFSKQTKLQTFRNAAAGKVKYIFQDPASSLNPRMNIKEILLSGYRVSPLWEGEKAALIKAAEILEKTGLPTDTLERRPTDFSGGQRQRISIARALMFDPEILICDEVVSALDLSIQSQILNLLADLKKEFKYTMLFISHDLNVVSYICDQIAVMYGGRILELGTAEQLTGKPLHPYTKLLYSSMPGRVPVIEEIKGPAYSPVNPPAGCPFHPRCPYVIDKCKKIRPGLSSIQDGRKIACYRWQKI